MKILYNCDDFVVCVKPTGVISESNGENGFPDLLGRELGCTCFTVHRLDKNVSGVIVYAKSSKAAAKLSEKIQSDEFRKTYYALVHGTVSPENGTMTDLLFKDKMKSKSFVVKRERKGVKRAELDYSTIKTLIYKNLPATLAEVKLKTGRFHQIRAQFSSRGYSIFGDRRYGAKDDEKEIMLFSVRLEFEWKNEPLSFEYVPDIIKEL